MTLVKYMDMYEGIDWVICGAEKGKAARYMPIEWAMSLREQCEECKVPFFLKQVSKDDYTPENLLVREYPHE